MSHELLADARIFSLLFQIDRELADEVHAGRCAECGGRLHRGKFPRKPRGGLPPELKEAYSWRFSLCCAVKGCRTRATPPSVRFLGRRVYLGVVILLISTMIHGVTDKRLAELHERGCPALGKDTLLRWREWWRDTLPATPFWRDARARFARPLDEMGLPETLLAAFGGSRADRLVAALRFLAPLTTRRCSARAG